MPHVLQSRMQSQLRDQLWAEYQVMCDTPSDIHAHLPILKQYADRCTHVTEFGVRSGVSSRAFAVSEATHIRMYDIEVDTHVAAWAQSCADQGRDMMFTQANTLSVTIEPTCMLFVDTLHNHSQLTAELDRHHVQVRRYIAMHDTHAFGIQDEQGMGWGLLHALVSWLTQHPEWRLVYHNPINNGMTIIERTVGVR